MKQTSNYALNKPEQTDTVNIDDLNSNFDTLDSELKKVSDKVNMIQTAGGTATAITLNNVNLVNGFTITFVVATNNGGAATTINGKNLYKFGGTSAPTLTAGKAVTVWYNGTSFFIKASAEGDAVAGDVLAGKKFSNDNDTNISGLIPVNPGLMPGTGHIESSGIAVGNYSPDNVNRVYLRPGIANQRQCIDGDMWITRPAPDLLSQNILNGKNILGIPGSAVGLDSILYSNQVGVLYGQELNAGNMVTTRRFYGFDNPIALATPSVLPGGSSSRAVQYSPNGVYLAVASTDGISVYKISGEVYTKIMYVSIVAGPAISVGWSGDSNYLAVGINGYTGLYIYKRSGDSFTLLSGTPNLFPSSQGDAAYISWSSDSNYLVVTSTSVSPYFFLFKRSGDSFTQLYFTTPWPGVSNQIAFSPDTNYVICGLNNSPYAYIYKRSGDTFTPLGNGAFNIFPASPDSVTAVAWSGDSTYLAFGTYNGQLSIYKRSGDSFTRVALLTTNSSYLRGLSFSPDSTYLIGVCYYQPQMFIYKRSGDTFTKLGNPAVMPGTPSHSVAHNAVTGHFTVAFDGYPYIRTYKGDLLGDYTYLYTGITDLFYSNYINFGICKEYGTNGTYHNIVTLPLK